MPWPIKVATIALPTREAHVAANVWPEIAGTLFFLSEFNLPPGKRQEFSGELTTAIQRVWATDLNFSLGPETVLEQIIAELNPILKRREGLLGNPLAPKYHILLALLCGRSLAASNIGHLDALVVNNNEITNVFTPAHRRAPAKAGFSSLVSGELEPGDVLVLATGALAEFVAPPKLQELLSAKAPGMALREIEQYLNYLPHHPPLGLIAVRLGESEESVTDGTTQLSIDRLLKTRAETSLMLKPSLWSHLKNHSPLAWKKPSLPKTAKQPNEETLNKSKKSTTPKVNLISKFNALAQSLSWLTSRESIKATLAWWLESKLTVWRNYPSGKRLIFNLALALLLAFSLNIVSLGRKQLLTQDNERYNRLTTQITETQSEIEANLIYRNDVAAAAKFTELKILINSLPRGTSAREQQYQALLATIDIIEQRLGKNIDIQNPNLLKTLDENTPWLSINSNGNNIFVISSTSIKQFTSSGINKSDIKTPNEIGNIKNVLKLGNLLWLAGDKSQAILSLKNSQSQIQNLPVAKTAYLYLGNIYYSNGNEIYKAPLNGLTLGASTRWDRNRTTTETSSLVVDGSMYTLNSGGVKKLTRGVEQNFNLKGDFIPGVLFTAQDKDYLYITSFKTKSVLIYNKEGAHLATLKFSSLNKITDSIIDSTNKIIYLLDGSKIYSVNITQYIR